jgi:hypothetical protein
MKYPRIKVDFLVKYAGPKTSRGGDEKIEKRARFHLYSEKRMEH